MNQRRSSQPGVNLARVWIRSNVISLVLLIFIIMSLALHALTIAELLRVRNTTNRQLELGVRDLARVRQQKIRYNFPVDQNLSIDTSVEINEVVTVPISITVPISETITLPIETPAGTFDFPIPLDLSVPVSDTIDIPINRTIPIKTDVPVKADIPVDLDLSEPPLGEILQQLEDALQALRDSL